jgi:molybdate transport system ATP-binding protein
MLRVAVEKQRGAFALRAAFHMPTPGVLALFGRSGCGKSTLVDILAGLTAADSGTVEFDGETLLDTARRIEVPAERRRFGYVFQNARLFPHLDVEANLRYAERRARGASMVSFDAVVALLELAALLRRGTHGLSGGERQRVAIGRALLSQPRLLLLDEPLASLDAARRDELLPYLEILRDRLRLPMVYVSHQFEEVLRLATHLVLMESGRTIAQGSLAEMSLRPELRSIVGPDAVGAVLDGLVRGREAATGLMRVAVGAGELKVPAPAQDAGTTLRVQILARDVIVATRVPEFLSVRNALCGSISSIEDDSNDADLVSIDIGGAAIMARLTKAATRDLGLHPGMRVWSLVKAVSLRGRAIGTPPTVI